MASRLQDVILRGTAGARPAATTVAPGTLYYSTDTSTTARCADTGLTWEDYSDGATGGGSYVVKRVSTQTGAVATGTTVLPLDDTIPQNTEGTQFLTLAITPANAANILTIEVILNIAFSVANSWCAAALFQDSTANALAVGWTANLLGDGNSQIVLRHVMVAGTTSATTLKVRAGANGAGTFTLNGRIGARLYGGAAVSSLVITETLP